MKKIQSIRLAIQSVSFAIFSYVILHFWGVAGAHRVCPFAAIEAPILALRHRIPLDFFVIGIFLGIFFFLLSFVFPRAFCGWVCPIGFASRILGSIGRKLRLNKTVPVKRNDKLAWFAFIVLICVALATFISGRLICMVGCPFFWGYAIWAMPIMPIAAGLITIFAIGSLFIERFFCRWFCPFGALLGIAGRFSIFAIRRKKECCSGCGLCYDCPMGTLPKKSVVDGPMCISCMRCTGVCKAGCLSLEKRRK